MLRITDATYTYVGQDAPALSEVCLTLEPGRVLAIVGGNGCGKSTLGRVANGSIPCEPGVVEVDGHDPATSFDEERIVAAAVGLVRQDPRCQLVSSRVFDEIAFGPCNLGLSPSEVVSRVDKALSQVGLQTLAQRPTAALSGGEQQRLAIAGVLAMHPSYLILDEVTAQLDPESTTQVQALVRQLASQGMGVIEITHDALEVAAADEVVEMEDGRIVWQGNPADFLANPDEHVALFTQDDPLGPALRLLAANGLPAEAAVDATSLHAFAASRGLASHLAQALEASAAPVRTPGEPVLEVTGLRVGLGGQEVLHGVDMTLSAGELRLVCGRSGCGKTTLSRTIAGVLDPTSGSVTLDGAPARAGLVGLSFQRPDDQLFCATIRQDVAFGPSNQGLSGDELDARVDEALSSCGLDSSTAQRSPFALSGGQRRRAAIAGVIACQPRAYVFDEPTAGLDAQARQAFHELVVRLSQEGAPVIIVSHDLGEWLDLVDTVTVLDDGVVAWDGIASQLVVPGAFPLQVLGEPCAVALRRLCATPLAGDLR